MHGNPILYDKVVTYILELTSLRTGTSMVSGITCFTIGHEM